MVLFRLEEVGVPADGAAEERIEELDTSEYATFSGDALGGPRQGASRPYPQPTDAVEAEYRRTGTVALPAIRARAETETEARRRRRRAPRRSPRPRSPRGAAGAGGASRPGRSWR